MNFTEAVAEVVSATKRPDLLARTKREVNSAITFFCLDTDFPRDFREQAISITATEYTQTFLLSLMTRWRKFKYLKRGGTKYTLSTLSDAELIKGCAENKDKYYIVGDNVNIWLKELAATLDVGFYVYPPVLTDVTTNRTHWLLDVQPYCVIDRAIAMVLKNIGDESGAKNHFATSAEAYRSLRKDILSSI